MTDDDFIIIIRMLTHPWNKEVIMTPPLSLKALFTVDYF